MPLSSLSSFESYQVNSKFPPNKESTWSSCPIESHSMILAHNAVRGELSYLKQALNIVLQQQQQQQQEQACSDWQISAIQRMWASHFIHMDSDYHKEEDQLKPRLQQRFRIPESKALDSGIVQHHLTNLKSLIGELASTTTTTTTTTKTTSSDTAKRHKILSAMQEEFMDYETSITSYMLEKETMILPLIRAYFTCSEWSKLLRDVFSNVPAQSTGSLIHFQTEHGFRTGFMKREGIPSLVWYLVFRGLYNTYRNEFVQPYEQISSSTTTTSTSITRCS